MSSILAVEPRRPGAGAPGVAVRASTPVRHGGPRVRKKHIRSARVPEIENFHTGAVAEDERRGAGEREDLPGHHLGLSAVCSDVAFVDIVLKEAIVVCLRRVN